MTNVNLHLDRALFNDKTYPLIFDYGHRWEVWYGGAGSGKSFAITQKLIIRACRESINILVCRRFGTTLRNSVWSLFKEILHSWKLTQYVSIKESTFRIEFPNGSNIIFTGLDDETKLLSLNNISCVWVEEAFEVPKDIVEQLNLRMRGQAANQQIILSFNPISKSSWLYDFCELHQPESFVLNKTTYKDNKFLSAEYIATLDEMETRNPDKYRIFGLGDWGVAPEGLVIKNWQVADFDEYQLVKDGCEHRVGMDLGYLDPSAIIETVYDKKNKTIYVFNEFYKSGCQLSDLVKAIQEMGIGKCKIYVDSAEPRSIEYFKGEGIRATGCIKGKDSVKNGLMFLQDNKIIVKPKCKSFINELENFSYIKSKTTGEYTEDTTHEYSHSIDACRYAFSDVYTSKKIQTFSKASFGL